MRHLLKSAMGAAALLAAPVAAQPGPASSLGCVYDGTDGPTLLRATEEVDSEAREAARDAVRAVVDSCAQRHGWSPPAAGEAARYAFGRRIEESADARLRHFGFSAELLRQIADRLSVEQRTAMLRSGDPTLAVRLIDEALTARGVGPGARSADEQESLGAIIGEGLAARLIQLDAAQRFASPD